MRKKLHSVTAFDVILAIIMVLICFACVYPMWYILANSLAAPEIANRGPVAWWPKALSLDAYKVVFQNEYILSGFKITILRTVVATFTHVFFTSMVAYGMSRKDLIGKKFYLKIAMITMFFNGGLIPNFILMIKLKLYNTFWVYILPGMFTFYNMVIFMSFFRSIPESLIESARFIGKLSCQMPSRSLQRLDCLRRSTTGTIITRALFIFGIRRWNRCRRSSTSFWRKPV